MKDAPYNFRGYQSGDEYGALAVLQAAFLAWPRTAIDVDPLDHLRWKMGLDHESSAQHLLAECDGRIVGVVVGMDRLFKLENRTVRGASGYDASIHPEFQRQGLIQEMQAAAAAIGAKDHPFDITFAYRSWHPALEKLRERKPFMGVYFGNLLQQLECNVKQPPTVEVSSNVSLRQVDRFDDRTDAFWSVARKPFDFALERTRLHLNWRYCDPRAGRFTTIVAEDGAAMAGYAVLSGQKRALFIADLLVLPDRSDVAETLIHEALRIAATEAYETCACCIPMHHPYRIALARFDFSQKRRTIECRSVPVTVDKADFNFLADPRAPIHVTLGDTDLI